MTAAVTYSCDATILGRQIVSGSLSNSYLTSLISNVQKTEPSKDDKCLLEIGAPGFIVHFIRKDEGFESDTESTTSSSISEREIKCDRARKDSDDTSSANSSASEPEELDSVTVKSGLSKSQVSSFDRVKEIYPISDILFCHTVTKLPKYITFVIRHHVAQKSTVDLEALVFSSRVESTKKLYESYIEISKRLKFDRYRLSKRRLSGEFSVKPSNVTVNNILLSKEQDAQPPPLPKTPQPKPTTELPKLEPEVKWNLVQHTDSNGITHIEIEGSQKGEILITEDASESESIISINTPETQNMIYTYTDTMKSSDDRKKNHNSRQRQPLTDRKLVTPPETRSNKRGDMNDKVRYMPKPQAPPRTKTKGLAPKPPPKPHPTRPDTYLVPTKSGAEPTRTLYPKDPYIVSGKFLRMSVPNGFYGYPPMNGHFSTNDLNNNRGRRPGPHMFHQPSAEMHFTRRSRDVTPNPIVRRRSRSKSPPRKPMAHRYIDVAMPTFTGISQKFKEFSESVMQKKLKGTWDGSQYPKYLNSDSPDINLTIKSESALFNKLPKIIVVHSNDKSEKVNSILKVSKERKLKSDNRNVKFTQYATVQIIQ